MREGLQLLIDGQPDMRVVGEAGTGKEVIRAARELDPDVVVMDLSMPELNGLQATQALKAEKPGMNVIVLTVHEDETYLLQLCKAGAAGYVLKRSAGDDLIQAIRTVAGGGRHYDPSLAAKALAGQVSQGSLATASDRHDLSPREKQVLVNLAWGHSNKEIAAELELSIKTVETYKVRVSEKLGLRSRTEMVQYALRQGWLDETASSP